MFPFVGQYHGWEGGGKRAGILCYVLEEKKRKEEEEGKGSEA